MRASWRQTFRLVLSFPATTQSSHSHWVRDILKEPEFREGFELPTWEGEGSGLGPLYTPTACPDPLSTECNMPFSWDLKPRHPIYLPFLRSWELTLWAPQLVIPPAQNSSHQLPPPGNCTNLALSGTHTNHSHLWAVFFLQKIKSPSHNPLCSLCSSTPCPRTRITGLEAKDLSPWPAAC